MNEEREEILEENAMLLQEVPENEQNLGYKEKEDDELYLGEDILQQLREMREQAQMDLAIKEGYQNYNIVNVVHYNKKVELIAVDTKQIEYYDLCVVTAEELNTGEIIEIYYLGGEEANISELMKKYESPTPIKDVIIATDKNLELDLEDRDDELVKDDLEKLEEKEKEDSDKSLSEKNKEQEGNTLTGTNPKYMIQTIDVDKTYIDNKTTVRKAFKIPKPVQGLAIAKPMQEDENVLSSDMTMYMLDSSGRVIENVDGKTIKEFFQIDKATGNNPISDENTKIELDGYAERNKNHTMRRFVSKQNPNMHLSVEQKTMTEYTQIYAGRKTMDGNDSVEIQLETRNIGIQTSLEMQKISSGYKGIYNIEDIDREVDQYEASGGDIKNIAIENADGKSYTVGLCNSPYIPGTEMTWEELSKETGESVTKLQERFVKEAKEGKEPLEILGEIEYDYGMVEHTRGRT